MLPKTIKILYVVTQGEMGGAQRYVLDLAEALSQRHYQVAVALGAEKPALKLLLEQQGIPVYLLQHLIRAIRPVKDFQAVWELRNLIRKLQPDVVHLNSTKAGIVGSIAAPLAGCKRVVFTAHGFAFLEPGNIWKKKFYYWAEKLTSQLRQKIITVSENDRQAALRLHLAPTQKILTIHNGLTPPEFLPRPQARQALGDYTEQDLLLGNIAYNYPTKDLPTFYAAVNLVKQQIPRAKVVVIGDGSPVDGSPQASEYLPAFDVFVKSSIKEGFPYTILEAMAAGLPIVSTAVGGIPEALKNGQEGLLVPPRDPAALARAIIRILNDPGLAKTLGQNAQARLQEFSLEKMVEKTLAVYRELTSAQN